LTLFNITHDYFSGIIRSDKPCLASALVSDYGSHEFCKTEVRHTLKRKKSFFDFFFSNSKSLSNKKLADYLRKFKKTVLTHDTGKEKQ